MDALPPLPQPAPARPGVPEGAKSGFRIEPLYWLLIAVPVAMALRYLAPVVAGWTGLVYEPGNLDLWIFVASCVAIIPLAGLMGRATENLSETLGAGIGGLLNATFGNAAELIIALMALWAARDPARTADMYALVKASLTGSIIGNILLVLGLAILAGGLYYPRQVFNRTAASMGATLLALASIGLLIPTLYYEVFRGTAGLEPEAIRNIENLSEEIALILGIVYVFSLIFSLRTHQHLFAGPEEELPTTGEGHQPEWGRRTSLIVLLVSTAGVALMSELLVGTVEHAGKSLGLTDVFLGVIVVAVIGNAAEHSTAVLVAMKNKMDLAVTISISSSIQIALFVTPVLVLASVLMGMEHPLDLHFSPMEMIVVILAVGVLTLVCQDGESHWMEGVLLLAVYLIIGLAFYHLPEAARPVK